MYLNGKRLVGKLRIFYSQSTDFWNRDVGKPKLVIVNKRIENPSDLPLIIIRARDVGGEIRKIRTMGKEKLIAIPQGNPIEEERINVKSIVFESIESYDKDGNHLAVNKDVTGKGGVLGIEFKGEKPP